MKLRHLDLFSGIGGFSLGLERTQGFETVAFCEMDKAAQKVLKKHWSHVPIFDDVKTLKGADVGTVDIITGGFPCQDISVAGRGAGLAGERSGLWFEFHRLIEETKPKWVIAENVSALRSRGLDQVLRSLFEIGYDAEWHCIPASAIGAPHRRDRIWIVAHPMHRQCYSRSKEQGVLREMQENGAVYDNTSRRSEAHPFDVSNTNGSLETNGRECQTSEGQSISRGIEQRGSISDDWERCIRSSGECSEDDVSNSSIKGLEGQRTRTISAEQKESLSTRSSCVVRSINYSDFWKVEPNMGRVANGVSGRVDRLKQLGNAVVPQIPEMIGRAILAAERSLV